MSAPPREAMWMFIVTAHAERLGFLAVCAALAAGALALRTAQGRRWYDVASTFALLTVAFTGIGYLGVQVLAEIAVAGIEFIAWRE